MLAARAHSFVLQTRLAISLAWVAGYTNAIALEACGVAVSHVTGHATALGRDAVLGNWRLVALLAALLAAFLVGAFLSGLATEFARLRGRASIYIAPAALEIALLKLCYADIERSTDIDKLPEHYANTVKLVALERPNLRIVHCTVPLKEHQRGAKAAMKKLVGAGSDAINAVRGRYNDALRRIFAADEILDIASAESTRADGSRVTFAVDGVHWPALASEYTDDGGHLTAKGQLVVAREMLLALSRTCPKPEAAKPTTDVASEPTEGSGR